MPKSTRTNRLIRVRSIKADAPDSSTAYRFFKEMELRFNINEDVIIEWVGDNADMLSMSGSSDVNDWFDSLAPGAYGKLLAAANAFQNAMDNFIDDVRNAIPD